MKFTESVYWRILAFVMEHDPRTLQGAMPYVLFGLMLGFLIGLHL